MSSGKMDERLTKRTGKYRLRFYAVAPDQLEIIKLALKLAREECNTNFDSVALDAICLEFIATRN